MIRCVLYTRRIDKSSQSFCAHATIKALSYRTSPNQLESVQSQGNAALRHRHNNEATAYIAFVVHSSY